MARRFRNATDLAPGVLESFIAGMAVATVAACQPPVPPDPGPAAGVLHLTTEFPSYAPGAEVTLLLRNPTPREYGYNLCHSRVERLEQEQWIEVHPMLAEACTMELRLLQAGGEASYTFRLHTETPAGLYRARTTIEEMDTGRRLDLPSTTFTVTPPGS